MPTTDFDWEPADGQLLSFTVTYTIEPFRAAVINADPDDCHPPEGGICDIEVELQQAEVVWWGDEAVFQRWFRVCGNAGWPDDFAEFAEAAVLKECADELLQACCDDADAARETALADLDDANKADRERRLKLIMEDQ